MNKKMIEVTDSKTKFSTSHTDIYNDQNFPSLKFLKFQMDS